MKHLFFLAIAICCISCGGGDALSDEIIGTWDVSSLEVTGCDNLEENQPPTEPDSNGCVHPQGDVLCNSFITFTENGIATLTGTDADGDIVTQNFVYTVNDDNDTAQLCEAENDCDLLIRYEDGELRLNFPDASCNFIYRFKK